MGTVKTHPLKKSFKGLQRALPLKQLCCSAQPSVSTLSSGALTKPNLAKRDNTEGTRKKQEAALT